VWGKKNELHLCWGGEKKKRKNFNGKRREVQIKLKTKNQSVVEKRVWTFVQVPIHHARVLRPWEKEGPKKKKSKKKGGKKRMPAKIVKVRGERHQVHFKKGHRRGRLERKSLRSEQAGRLLVQRRRGWSQEHCNKRKKDRMQITGPSGKK